MNDRDKAYLLKELTRTIDESDSTAAFCLCQRWILKDALTLLKEQEAKTGTWQWKIHGKPESGGTLGEAVCDQCGKSTYATAVKGTLNYCPNCGANMMDRR